MSLPFENTDAKWWQTADGHSPSLSKASLGAFFYNALRCGAKIGKVWPINPCYDRSGVYITIFMTEQMKQHMEEVTRFKFRPPLTVNLN